MAGRPVDNASLRQAGLDAGLDVIGVATAEPFDDTRRDLEIRRAAGLHGGMQFTYRNPARSTDPGRALPGCRAMVVGGRAYRPSPRERARHDGRLTARVAAYAQHDHYGALRDSLGAVAARLTALGWSARVLVDDNALVDRAAAHRAGLGWYGKNSNLLVPGHGSWFLFGAVLTDAPLEPDGEPVADGCGACRRCLAGCPTGAIVAPGVVDARRCLAWLLQQDGDFPLEYRAALGDRIYGCDDCQEVCPHNDDAGGEAAQPSARVSVVAMLTDDDRTLLARHGRWYIPRRDPRYLRRNALVVLGNIASPDDPTAVALVERHLHSDDEMLRRHAEWAAERMGRVDLLAR